MKMTKEIVSPAIAHVINAMEVLHLIVLLVLQMKYFTELKNLMLIKNANVKLDTWIKEILSVYLVIIRVSIV